MFQCQCAHVQLIYLYQNVTLLFRSCSVSTVIVSPFGFLPHHTATIPHLHRVTFRASSASKSGGGAKVKESKGENITLERFLCYTTYFFPVLYLTIFFDHNSVLIKFEVSTVLKIITPIYIDYLLIYGV